ncbi:unnamed protein product [Trichogramma brassicae]|uniref:Cytochrome c domain-containing protein n=1 Tax=Trichogramma brassicae TaxID=86971 RepID=A0A6H5IYI9_9HYME|nr:unnamed protein product [Trichogramma brassicae]
MRNESEFLQCYEPHVPSTSSVPRLIPNEDIIIHRPESESRQGSVRLVAVFAGQIRAPKVILKNLKQRRFVLDIVVVDDGLGVVEHEIPIESIPPRWSRSDRRPSSAAARSLLSDRSARPAVQRSPTRLVPRVELHLPPRVAADLEESPHQAVDELGFLGNNVQRRRSFLVGQIRIGATSQQQLDHTRADPPRVQQCLMQRRVARLVPSVDRLASVVARLRQHNRHRFSIRPTVLSPADNLQKCQAIRIGQMCGLAPFSSSKLTMMNEFQELRQIDNDHIPSWTILMCKSKLCLVSNLFAHISHNVRPLLARLLKHRIGSSSSSEFIGLDRCYSARSRRCFWTLASDNFDRSKNNNNNNNNNNNRSSTTWCRLKKVCLGLALVAGSLATCGTVVLHVLGSPVVEAGNASVHPPKLPWGFNGTFASLDHSSVRRGWQVYKSVCSACHSLQYVAFKDLVDVCCTEDEVRDMCSEYEVKDGPNEEGEYFLRPAKLSDKVPGPYENEEAARFANNAALPVDLSFVVNARHHGPDYVFGLLTGYREPPAGVELMDGQAFNPYFEGGALGMMEVGGA